MAVLYLDVDDEITSAAARIRAIDEDRIAVVLPFGSRLATSRMNFKLLAHEATSHGKTIEVIAADASARALAMTAGLTVHPSVAAFERGGAGERGTDGGPDDGRRTGAVIDSPTTVMPVPAREIDSATGAILIPRAGGERVPIVGRVRPPVRPGVAIGVALGVLALALVGGIVAFAFLPSATVILSPWSRAIGPQQVQVVADPGVTVADAASLTVPAQRFTFHLQVQQTFPATGIKVTDMQATGTAEFSNFDTGGGVFIPAGTIVQTQTKIQFRTTADLTLPHAQVDFFPPFSTHPSTGAVGIQAVKPGETGNVGANTIIVIPKAGKLLKVTNPDPTAGGAHTEATVVSQDDVDKALAALNAALPPELDRQIAGMAIPSGVTLYDQTKALGTVTPSVDPATLVGQAVAQFDLGLAADGTELGVDATPIQALADARLMSEVETGWTLDNASTIVQVGNPAITGDRVSFPVTIAGLEVRHVDQATLLAQIKGLDIPAARARLDDFGSVEIRVWPDWVTAIPNSDRATLTIGEPAPEPSPSP